MVRLKQLRKQAGMTMRQVAELLGVSDSAISLYESGKRSPGYESLRLLADHFGVTVDYLIGREEDEWLARLMNTAGAIPETGRPLIPVYGAIRAGSPILAHEEAEGWYPAVGLGAADPNEHFYLRVKGDSMNDAGIFDRSLVLFRAQRSAEDGQIVACLLEGEEATVKRFTRNGTMVALLPENRAYKPILLTVHDFDCGRAVILGVATKIVTELDV